MSGSSTGAFGNEGAGAFFPGFLPQRDSPARINAELTRPGLTVLPRVRMMRASSTQPMTPKREHLLPNVADHHERLWDLTQEHRETHGLGAIVFTRDDAEITTGRLECEYWPMEKLRDCLRQLDEYDESVYRWLKQAEESDALPVVVFAPGSSPGTLDLTVHTMTQAHRKLAPLKPATFPRCLSETSSGLDLLRHGRF